MSIRDKIAARQSEAERIVVEVEQWDETIYSGPITAHDVERVSRKYKNFLTEPSLGAMVEMIILKAEDSGGGKVFTMEDKPMLMREPVGTIASVFGAIFKANDPEEHEKN